MRKPKLSIIISSVLLVLTIFTFCTVTCYKYFYDKEKKAIEEIEKSDKNKKELEDINNTIKDKDETDELEYSDKLESNINYILKGNESKVYFNKNEDLDLDVKLLQEVGLNDIEGKINKQVLVFPYTLILENITHDELFKKYAISHAINIMEGKGVNNSSFDEDVKSLAKSLSLTDEEINKIDNKLWEPLLSGCMGCQKIYRGIDTLKEAVNKLYNGYKYNIDFENITRIDGTSGSRGLTLIYDKNIDAIVTNNGGASSYRPIIRITTITDTKRSDDKYTIKFIDTEYQFKERESTYDETPKYCYVIDKNNKYGKIKCFTDVKDEIDDNIKNQAYQYTMLLKDELPQYEVSFKINSDNTYEFIEIKKV